jgi:hypothetical protein
MPKEDTQFKPGSAGRPVGAVSGRTKMINAMDSLLSKEGNKQKIMAAWQKEIDKNAAVFWNRYVLPLLPKESLVKVLGGSEMGRGLVDAVRMALAARVEESRPETIAARVEESRPETTDADSRRSAE